MILGALVRFTATMTAYLQVHRFTPAGVPGMAGYVHSGYSGVASVVLGDALAGGILTGLVLAPLALLGVAFLGAVAGTGLRQLTAQGRRGAVS